jgi:hypothetical protein
MASTSRARIWLVPLVFLLLAGCTSPAKRADAPSANKRSATDVNPISSNEYEFGVIKSLCRPAWSKKEFCFLVHNPAHLRRIILCGNNRLAFDHSGGFRNAGLCWWHSRLTRSATYLTVYRPDLPKPTKEQAAKIVDAWIHNSRVVEIGGYKNLREFSRDWRDVIRKKLERWQLVDGVARFQWIRGITGKTKVSPEELKDRMDKLFKEVRLKDKIVYQKLQAPGIYKVSSWLVVDMKKVSDGYILRVADSDYPGLFTPAVKNVRYRIGDRYIRGGDTHFVPYTERAGDLKEIRAAQRRYCHSK